MKNNYCEPMGTDGLKNHSSFQCGTPIAPERAGLSESLEKPSRSRKELSNEMRPEGVIQRDATRRQAVQITMVYDDNETTVGKVTMWR